MNQIYDTTPATCNPADFGECSIPRKNTTAELSKIIDEDIAELTMITQAVARFVTGEEDANAQSEPVIRCLNDDLQKKHNDLRRCIGYMRLSIEALGLNV